MIILCVTDLETTGLIDGYHEPIELAMGFYDTEMNSLGYSPIDIRIMPKHPHRISEGALNVNGFDKLEWENTALTKVQAVRQIQQKFSEIHEDNMDKDIRFVLTGLNIGFDKNFLNILLEKTFGETVRTYFHYRPFDISSFAFGLGIHDNGGSALGERFGIGAESLPHRAYNGVKQAVNIYEALAEYGLNEMFERMASTHPEGASLT